jgi:hypothetical protein
MNLRDFIPPVFRRPAPAGVEKSALSASFVRGADLDGPLGGSAGRLLEPYAQSAWVHRAIRLKVDEIGRVPLKFYAGESEYQADPAFTAWWQTPFLGAAGQKLGLQEARRQLASWPDLGGESFVLLGDDWLNPFASRNGVGLSHPIIAKPEKMRHVVQAGQIIGWVFTDAGNHQHTLLPEQVIHTMEWNPYNEFRGLATVRVVFNAAEADYLAGLYVRNLMRNNGDQGVYVIAKGGIPTDEQREQIVASLREKRAKALRGDFAPVFLTGDIQVEDPKAESTDVGFNDGRRLSSHEIFLGLGVPPSMADVKASYSTGADSDRLALITGSSMPLSAKVDGIFGLLASRMTGQVIEAETDWDEHPVVQNVRRERIDSALKLWGVGMPLAAANQYLDLGMSPFPGWDIGYLPFSVAPVSPGGIGESPMPSADPEESPEFNEDAAEDDSLKALRLLVLARARTTAKPVARAVARDPFEDFACGCSGLSALSSELSAYTEQKADRPPSEIAHWKTLMTARRSTIASFKSAVGRVLMSARVEVLKNIAARHVDPTKFDQAKTAAGIVGKNVAADFLFDVAKFAVGFRGAMENQQKAALDTAGQQFFDEIKRTDPWKSPPEAVKAFVAARENKLRNVPQAVFDRVKAQLQAGLDAGESTAQLSARVKAQFNDLADGDAKRIALTETAAAYGSGRDTAMRAAGVQYKAWLTSGNANVRAAHFEAGFDYRPETAIPFDEPFIVGGEELMHPGDSAGSAGNVINCHCVSIAVKPPEDAS